MYEKLFNYITSSRKYPIEWKTSFMKPIHKNDSAYEPSNYRGIPITSCYPTFLIAHKITELFRF